MKSFFSRIRDYFKKEYGGRYFSTILREMILEVPETCRLLFPDVIYDPRRHIVVNEFPFDGRRGLRLADVAVVQRLDETPVALLEVKDEDEKEERNHAQLSDYVAASDYHGCAFTLLAPHPPSSEDRMLMGQRDRCRSLTWAGLYRLLGPKADNPFIALLRRYLEETTTVFTTSLDQRTVTLLLAKGLNLPHNAGLGRKLVTRERVERVGPTLDAILGNVATLGDELFRSIGPDYFAMGPTIDFGFIPHVREPKRADILCDDWGLGGARALRDEFCIGGVFVGWARNRFPLGKNDWLYSSVGLHYYLDCRKKETHALRCKLFAGIFRGSDSIGWEGVPVALNASESVCLAKLGKCSLGAVKKALDRNDLSTAERNAFKEFKRRLEKSPLGRAAEARRTAA